MAKGREAGKVSKRLTDTTVRTLPGPKWHPDGPADYGAAHLGLRVTDTGRAFAVRATVAGKPAAVTIGKPADAKMTAPLPPGVLTLDDARTLAAQINTAFQAGGRTDLAGAVAHVKADREAAASLQAREAANASATFGELVRTYVREQRRRDDKPLAARTVADYLGMIAPAVPASPGKRARKAGLLHALALRPVGTVTGDDVRRIWAQRSDLGERQTHYALQLLRAVLRFHGVALDGNPFDTNAPKARRISLPPMRTRKKSIPADRLGAWYRAAQAAGRNGIGGSREAGRALQVLILTAWRPGDLLPGKVKPGLQIRDCNITGQRVLLRDRKNRKDSELPISSQVSAILAEQIGRRKSGPVFKVRSLYASMRAVNAAAGFEAGEFSPYNLRHSAATLAANVLRLPPAILDAILDHAPAASNVTQAFYVDSDAEELAKAWQAIADHIEAAA